MTAPESKGVPFLERLKNILLKPKHEWKVIQEEQTTYGKVISGYIAVIAAVPPMAAVADRLIFGREIAGSSPIGYVFATNILWYFVIIMNMIITAAVMTAIVSSKEPGWVGLRGIQLAGYSYTPLFLVGILITFTGSHWLIYCAALYSLFLLYLGIRSMTGAGQGKAAWYTAASFLAAAAIVGALNIFEYMLESFIAGKLFL